MNLLINFVRRLPISKNKTGVKKLIEKINGALAQTVDASERNAIVRAVCCDMLGIASTTFYVKDEVCLTDDQEVQLEDILARLRRGEPLQYIEGRASFCGMNMVVRPGVLIPRPETAELVDWVVDDYASQRPGVLDMGTGSGCIAIALSKRLQQARVAACDISTEALAVAKENSELNVAAVELFRHDMLDFAKPLPRVYDVLVSNPPYILQSEAEEMERTVTEWEPHMALFVPDDDALRFYRAIAEWGMTEALKPGGSIYVEINQALGKETVALFENYGYKEVTLRKDIYGNDRMVKGVKSEE